MSNRTHIRYPMRSTCLLLTVALAATPIPAFRGPAPTSSVADHRNEYQAESLEISYPRAARPGALSASGTHHYLFSYFKGNGEDGLHLAHSTDGLNWKSLRGDSSFLVPTVGKDQLLRDPSIVHGRDGLYHMVWTLSWHERSIGYAESKDLIHWSPQRAIPVMEHEPGAMNSWAPELFFDEASNEYLIVWASTIPGRFPDTDPTKAGAGPPGWNHRLYSASTRDFRTFAPTKLFYDRGFNVIDAAIFRDHARYAMVLKDETDRPFTPQKNVRLAFSDHASGPYGPPTAPITGDYWAEGPSPLRVGDQWIVYVDRYRDRRFGALASRDLEHWTDVTGQLVMPSGAKHGTAFEVSAADAKALLDSAPPPTLRTGAERPMPLEWIDEATGHRVVRLSRRGGSNSSFYFHNNPFVRAQESEGDKMVFGGTTPNGRQLFAVNLRTLAVAQLTDRPGGVSGEIVAPRGREAIYQSRDSVFATQVDGRRTRLLTVLPADLHASVSTLNADETMLAGAFAAPALREILAKYPEKRDFFNRIYEAHVPHTLFTVELKNGEFHKIHEENTWLGHVQFSPTDPQLLMFCHEGPWHLVDRIWNIDLRTGALRQIHRRAVDGEIAGHEFWSPDGRTIWYDQQVPRSVTFYLTGADVKSGAPARYELTRDEWSIHFNQSPDGKLFAGDGGDSSQVARAKNGRWLYLFRPQGDRLVSERLVDMGRHGYKLEPNVHFSPDGRWVIFRANFEGEAQVYAVEVARRG